jgi:hypothetical protein
VRHAFQTLLAVLAIFAFLFTAGSNTIAQGIETHKTDMPTTINYQGYIKVNGSLFNGTDYF